MEYIKLIRPINLIIVLVTQLSIYYFFIYAYTNQAALNILHSILLCLTTVIITACGYIINDYYDIEIDKMNKPEKWIIGNVIRRKKALVYYGILCFAGFVISVYLAWKTNNWALLPLYPIAQLLLFRYAKVYKKKGLIGNLIVALMTAFVSGLIIVAERKFLSTNDGQRALAFILALTVFSFLLNFTRELIKDIEDMEGDALHGSTSFPIKYGVNKTKLVAITSLFLCLIFLIRTGDYLTEGFGIGYIAPLFIYFYLIYRSIRNASAKVDFTKISSHLKLTMIGGLIGMLILSKLTN